jgi:hypothetical protein
MCWRGLSTDFVMRYLSRSLNNTYFHHGAIQIKW